MPAGKNKQRIRFQSVLSHEQKHGRTEDRDYAVSDDIDWLIERQPGWKNMRHWDGRVQP
jgi:hypothetical protein